jgi:HAD superfamily hydrolase (TIGR01484 family)
MIISIDHQLVEAPEGRQPRGLFIMDFDGTLLRSDRTFSSIDLDALRQLGELGIIRTIATGRSLYSFNTVAVRDLPVDFVIFSMGAGVTQHAGGKVVRRVSLEPHEVKRACKILKTNRLDFMIHRTIPDNHMFSYFRSNEGNDDFERRLKLYSRFAVPLNEATDGFGPAAQLLAVVPNRGSHAVLEKVRSELPDYSVIRTTSPLDGKATWIEIFPTVVSKSLTAAWLAEELKIGKREIVSVGNDYNDLDLLEWTAKSYVVDNAPADLKNRFAGVASNNNGGVAEAARCSMESTFGDG